MTTVKSHNECNHGSFLETNEFIKEESLDHLPKVEKNYVVNTYNNIATSFSRTRYKPWNMTIIFINSLSPNSRVLEVGSGNCKNHKIRNDIYIEGIDVSVELAKISMQMGFNVRVGDGCNLPYKDNIFDAVFSIATAHHLSSKKRRQQFLKEMTRVCKPNGKIMIEVWADTDPKFNKSDTLINGEDDHDKMVKFTNRDQSEYMRYYHFFNKEEFIELIESVQDEHIKLEGDITFESENWIFIGSVWKKE